MGDKVRKGLSSQKLYDMCNYLGIARSETNFFWIAELALLARLPPNWKVYKDAEGHAYFHNHATGVTSWTHPRDGYFMELVKRERSKVVSANRLADQQRTVKWDPKGCPEEIELSNGNMTATVVREGMYPSARAANRMVVGVHCFQMSVDNLEEDGYMHIGMSKENVHYNADAIPAEDYSFHGYSTVGELYVCGKLVKKGIEKVQRGDLVTVMVDFSDRIIVWYRNNHPITYYEGFEGSEYYPAAVFGLEGYKLTIKRLPAAPPPIMKWYEHDLSKVYVYSHGLVVRSKMNSGFVTARCAHCYEEGDPYFEMSVDVLSRDGFLMLGIANREVVECETQYPSEMYNHCGLASSGEVFCMGVRAKSDLPRIQKGDVVGLRLFHSQGKVVFYLNDKPIVEQRNLATYEQYYPCVTFGNAGYELGKDNLLVKASRAQQCVTVLSDIQYESGLQYFEVSFPAIHPDAELCVGIAAPSIVDNFRVLPAPEFNHFGYMMTGEIVGLGQVVRDDRPRIRIQDRVELVIDYGMEEITFFHNGYPVSKIQDKHVRGRLRPCITCAGPFEALINPTPMLPAMPPEWDPTRRQEAVEISKDGLTASVKHETGSARSVWGTTIYSHGVLYLEMVVELHGRTGYLVFGVGNRNFAGGRKFSALATLPLEEYYIIGYTSRGDVILGGYVARRGEEQWSNSDRMGLMVDFDKGIFAAYKNGQPVVIGDCPGINVGVSPVVTMISGPHSVRLVPMPLVPHPPHRWDSELCHQDVVLSNYDRTAKNRATSGYPTIVSAHAIRHGQQYIEFFMEYLPESSFLMLGLCSGPAHAANTRMLPGEIPSWSYSSTGEIWVRGVRVQSSREPFMTDDTFGFLVDVDQATITFFRNGYPVGFCSDVQGDAVIRGLRPFCTFGYTNYTICLNSCARLPEGSPRYDMVYKSPDIHVSQDHLTSTCLSYLACHTVRGTSGASTGVFYFEVRVNYVKLGGYLALALGAHNIYQNKAVRPVAHYHCFAYTSQGEILSMGQTVIEGLPRIVSGDSMGLRADFSSGLLIFYKNRHPVGHIGGISGELFPAVIYGNEKFSTTIYTNARQRLEVPSFHQETAPKGIRLEAYDMTAKNVSGKGFPTARASSCYRSGTFAFEVTVESLEEGGFLSIGIGSLNIAENKEYMPPEKFNSFCFTSSGEMFALGQVVSGGHEHFYQGDVVGFICNLDKLFVNFFINAKEVGEMRNLSPNMEYTPFVVFGNGNFKVTINRVPKIGKILALQEKMSQESKSSRQKNFLDNEEDPHVFDIHGGYLKPR